MPTGTHPIRLPLSVSALTIALLAHTSPSFAKWTACAQDIAAYCAPATMETMTNCLSDNWGRISEPCRDELIEADGDACLKVGSRDCRAVGPKTSLRQCIDAHLAEASAVCKKKLSGPRSSTPCSTFNYKFCKGEKNPSKQIQILMDHIEEISPACLASLRWSPNWPKPCQKDARLLCPGKTEVSQNECLASQLDRLSPLC